MYVSMYEMSTLGYTCELFRYFLNDTFLNSNCLRYGFHHAITHGIRYIIVLLIPRNKEMSLFLVEPELPNTVAYEIIP